MPRPGARVVVFPNPFQGVLQLLARLSKILLQLPVIADLFLKFLDESVKAFLANWLCYKNFSTSSRLKY
jgi:hypothetical protein